METLIDFLFLLFSLAAIFLFIGTFAYAGIIAAPWVPTRKRDIERVLRLSQVKPNEILYDLGSGDGRIIIAAAQHFGARSVGYEIAFLPYIYSYVKIIFMGLFPKARVRFKNFFKENLKDADVIVTFLLPKGIERLKKKYEKELRVGSRVVSCAWEIPGWTPERVDKPNTCEIAVYVYIIK